MRTSFPMILAGLLLLAADASARKVWLPSEAEWATLARLTQEASRNGEARELASWLEPRLVPFLGARRAGIEPPDEVRASVANRLWGQDLLGRALQAALPLQPASRALEVAESVFVADLVSIRDDRGSDGSLMAELADVHPVRGESPGKWLGISGPYYSPPPPPEFLAGGTGRDAWAPSRALEPPVRVLVMRVGPYLAGPLVPIAPRREGFLGADQETLDVGAAMKVVAAWEASHTWPPPNPEPVPATEVAPQEPSDEPPPWKKPAPAWLQKVLDKAETKTRGR